MELLRGVLAIAGKDLRLEPRSRNTVTSVKDLYWSFILPLAGLFEGVRKLFEKASAIRAAQRERICQKAIQEGHDRGHREGRQQVLAEMRSRLQRLATQSEQDVTTGAMSLTPEVIEFLLGESPDPRG